MRARPATSTATTLTAFFTHVELPFWKRTAYSKLNLRQTCDSHAVRTKNIRLTTTNHLTLKMTSAQVVETSVTTTDNSPSQDYTPPDDQITLLHVTPGSNHLL